MAESLETLKTSERIHIQVVNEATQLLKEVHLLLDQTLHHWDCWTEVDYEIDLLQTIILKLLYYY